MTIELNEQQVLELDELLKQTLEQPFVSETLRIVYGQIINKLSK